MPRLSPPDIRFLHMMLSKWGKVCGQAAAAVQARQGLSNPPPTSKAAAQHRHPADAHGQQSRSGP